MDILHEPIAYFFTMGTYATWLPGDQRGWVQLKKGWQLPDPIREFEARAKMTEDATILQPHERRIVEAQLVETCQHRGWILRAKNCRTNHLHAVISAQDVHPKRIRQDIKAWCTRRLKEQSDPTREHWWADRGSIRWIFDEESLDIVIRYVNDAQDRKHLDQ
jgi:REP element-mobilizing transposase RayT